MILHGKFYTIDSLDKEGEKIQAKLMLDPGHAIFTGHFPGQPVVPGVCMMQLVKEIVETANNVETRLIKADSLKFLRVIDPRVSVSLRLECRCVPVDGEQLMITSDLFAGEALSFKMKALLQVGS